MTRANSTGSGAIRSSELTRCRARLTASWAQRPGLGLQLQGLRVCHDVYLHSPFVLESLCQGPSRPVRWAGDQPDDVFA